MWFELADRLGDERAVAMRDSAEELLTGMQIMKARARADAFLASNYTDCD